MFDHYLPKPKYVTECNEIAEKISTGKPSITWDDILDFFIDLEKREQRYKRICGRKNKKSKKNRRFIKKDAFL